MSFDSGTAKRVRCLAEFERARAIQFADHDRSPSMCRSIKVLRRPVEVPATEREVQEAALQYVRKISGYRVPTAKNVDVFNAAVERVAEATRALLSDLPPARTPKPPAETQAG